MKTIGNKWLFLVFIGALLSLIYRAQVFSSENTADITSRSALEQSKTEEVINRLVDNVMTAFQVPGVAIGIVKDNKIIHLKGYGISNIDTGQRVVNIQ